MAIVVQVSGYIADTFRADGKMTTTHIRKMFTCGAYVGQAVFMLLTALIMRRGTSTVFLSLALGLGGLSWAGFGVNHLDIAPLYAPILMGISNTVGTLPGIMSPTLTGILIKDKTEEEWREVFLVTAAVYAIGALLYGLLASGEKQPWADGEEGLIESEAEKGEIRSDGGNYGATGGSEDQGCVDGEEVDDGANLEKENSRKDDAVNLKKENSRKDNAANLKKENSRKDDAANLKKKNSRKDNAANLKKENSRK